MVAFFELFHYDIGEIIRGEESPPGEKEAFALSEPKLITPLLDDHIMGEPISDHHGVRCCPAMHSQTEEKLMVKILSIPASPSQLDALLLSGAYPSAEAANDYFRGLADEAVAEAQLLKELSQLEGFAAYTDWQVVPMEDGIGFDVYLITPYGMTLERHMRRNGLSHLDAVNLGLDLCAALSVARRNGWLYVDLQPENILITDNHGYQICDLGFIRLDSLKYASLPEKYRSAYTAPEITDAFASLNTTMDIYAAGMILYQVFNDGHLPDGGDELLPPAYADYEMAQIILKACANDPAERWQDPQEMSQALIGYMQRNTVNDVPIIPPVLPVEEPPAEETDEPDEMDEVVEVTEENPLPESLLEETEEISDETIDAVEETVVEDVEPIPEDDVPDDTLPGDDDVEEYPDTVVTDEVSSMLAQADELIAHQTPDPVVAPEPIDVPMPPPILPEPEETEKEVIDEQPAEPETEGPVEEESDELLPEPEPEPIEEDEPAKPRKKGWIAGLISAILILALLVGCGYGFYNYYYLQDVRDISLNGTKDRLTVTLDTDIDNSLLTVTCTDTYGNKLTQPVEHNTATFTSLSSGTTYKIAVVISGTHQLTGKTAATYTTPAQTTIINFTAITGDTDGSAILNFSVQGPDSRQWKLLYTADGENPRTANCTGHMALLTGLTPGKTYSIRLIPTEDLYITSEDTIEFTASKVIYAQNLTIRGFESGVLSADWTLPEGTSVDSWTVRCYNSNGVDNTYTVTEPRIDIVGLDITQGYTLDVKANGMTVSRWTSISANSITFKEMLVDDSVPGKLTISWDFEGTAPEGGWNLIYTAGSSTPITVNCTENSFTLDHLVPGITYSFRFDLPADLSVFGGTMDYTTPGSTAFSGYGITLENLQIRPCIAPDIDDWDRKDLEKDDYTVNFKSGDKAGLVLRLLEEYETSKDKIHVVFVIRDAAGNILTVDGLTETWKDLWYRGYCELDLPALPGAPGEYSLQIFFNGQYLNQDPIVFTVE